MKTAAVVIAVLMVAAFITTEARPRRGNGHWGNGHGGNRPGPRGHHDEESDKPKGCQRRCPRPSAETRVCAFDGTHNRTFPSECFVEKFQCNTGRNVTIYSEGACIRVRDRSGESAEDTSNESNEEDTTTTQAPSTNATSEPTSTSTAGSASTAAASTSTSSSSSTSVSTNTDNTDVTNTNTDVTNTNSDTDVTSVPTNSTNTLSPATP